MKPRLQDMHPELQTKYLMYAGKMGEAGVPFALNCVIRTRAEQDAFFAQGRDSLEDVNAKRMTAGMRALHDVKTRDGKIITAEAQNIVVTHTRLSRHFPGPDGYSRAFDIMILRGDKRPTWDVKWDGDNDGIPDYLEAAKIGKECGLIAGGIDFGSFHDWPHFQLPDKA